ncbi:hypothetical protein H4R34_002384 [Dimargaris verticillata]|uniref:Uncharacterized protein n=1 Tax=Dimargaris verticillata TaxID=2761393 RepID=A0A9W8EDL6_9FUNG|nr:hypothetical protein H4R34_002384 [Dimargaris verticillata]
MIPAYRWSIVSVIISTWVVGVSAGPAGDPDHYQYIPGSHHSSAWPFANGYFDPSAFQPTDSAYSQQIALDSQPGMAIQSGYDTTHFPNADALNYDTENTGFSEYLSPTDHAWNQQHAENVGYAPFLPSGSQYTTVPGTSTDQSTSWLPLEPNLGTNTASSAQPLFQAGLASSAIDQPAAKQIEDPPALSKIVSMALVVDHQPLYDALPELHARVELMCQNQAHRPLSENSSNDQAFKTAFNAYLKGLKQRLHIFIDQATQGTLSYRFQLHYLAFHSTVEALLQSLQGGQMVLFVTWDSSSKRFKLKIPYTMTGSILALDCNEFWLTLTTPYHVVSFLTVNEPVSFDGIVKLSTDLAKVLNPTSVDFYKVIAKGGYLV